MLFSLAVILCLASVSNAVDCKAVSYSIAGATTTYPMDVCISTQVSADSGSGIVYYCDGDSPMIATYGNADCSGSPVTDIAFEVAGASNIESGCSMDACEYVNVKTYSAVVSDCENPDTSALTAYASVAYVAGTCIHIGVYKHPNDNENVNKFQEHAMRL